jgi:hypothetical protein
MATATKSQGQLLDWTLLNETVGVESTVLDSGEGYDTDLNAMLHVTMAHIDANANTGSPGFVVLVRVSATDEGWREFIRLSASTTTAAAQVLAAASGLGQGSPERIEVAATANFDGIGDMAFLLDAGTLADSCLVFIKDVVANDYVENIDELVNAYDTSDYLYDVVDQWSIELPPGCDEAKVLFFNDDTDSEFACRVDYSFVDAIA